MDGDGFYDFNLNCAWTILGDFNSVILLKPVYIILELSPACSEDFITIHDYVGIIFSICGSWNNTEAFNVESRLNHLYVQFMTNGIISARGFNFTYEILSNGKSDCLETLHLSDYKGTVAVTNHGQTCQAWAEQTPHRHNLFTDHESKIEIFNYCRAINTMVPWCLTTDPFIRWDYCTFPICNVTNNKCEEVLQARTGIIVSPDYDKDGLYDKNIDCLWIVEAPAAHVVQFHLYFVNIENTFSCVKDILQLFERKNNAYVGILCGNYGFQAGETETNALYVQFYSDYSIQGKGFNMSYVQLEASSIPSKDCTETFRQGSGWITPPDADADGFYDFNLNCLWTVEVDPSKLIRFQLMFYDLESSFDVGICLADYLEISDGVGVLLTMCDKLYGELNPIETRSNVLCVKFISNFMRSAKGFNLTYIEIERNSECFDELKSNPYSGKVSVTNNGILCQAWEDQIPHNHTENRDELFPSDKSVSKAKNYCRDIWGDGRPWCYTTDADILMGFCTLNICNVHVQSCGGVLYMPTGTLFSPDSNADSFYDLNVDCLWIIMAAEKHVIRLTIDNYDIEDSADCSKDALWIFESWSPSRPSFCGRRTEKLEGETLSNKLYVHFYSDDSVAFRGFQLTYVQKAVSIVPCGENLHDAFGWISAPDRDGDGLYDFNLECIWAVEVEKPKEIKFQVLYVLLDSCSDDADYLKIQEISGWGRWSYCGYHGPQEIQKTELSTLYITFIANNLDAGYGFNITYEEIQMQKFEFEVTGDKDGWIMPLDLNRDGLYDLLMSCMWFIQVPDNNVVEIEISFIRIEGDFPECQHDTLLIVRHEVFCGIRGRQAVIHTDNHIAVILFNSDYLGNDIGFLLAYKPANASRGMVSADALYCPVRISTVDADLNGQYDYNLYLFWIVLADDINNDILIKMLYVDIEDNQFCSNDHLVIFYSEGRTALICGTGFKKILPAITYKVSLLFKSDHTINAAGFSLSFSQTTGAMNKECGGVLTGSSEYITSLDANGDGYYDHGHDCQWTIRLEIIKVLAFEVLSQDIVKSSKCEHDFLEIFEDHRSIGRYCGDTIAPRFTTEANILFVLFHTDLFRSGKGFEAVYFEAEDVKACSPDYKCLLTEKTIHQDNICDTYSDCPYGDDERFCDFRCPRGCLCTGLSVDCTGMYDCGFERKPASFLNQTFVLSSTTRILDVSTNHEILPYLNLEKQNLLYLTHLNLSHCEITDLHVDTFQSMKNLKVLDLSFNKIRHLKANMLINQANLELFLLMGNSESLVIESGAFVGLVSVQFLNLSRLQIERISKGSFATLHLKELRVLDSHIIDIQSNSLDKLDAEAIYFNGSTIDTFKEAMFHGGANIELFVTDEYKFCCVRPLSVLEQDCYPQKDEISSCDDLIGNKMLRPLILAVGFFAILSNIGSLTFRFRHHAEQLKFCYGIAVSHLSASDSLLGIYLIIIGITDIQFRGTYIFHAESWRESGWCQIAGALSTVSCEASLLFICLITVDRFLIIKYPFGQKRLTRANGTVLAIVCWTIASFLAVIPFAFHSYFKGEFYSKSGLCLALPLTRERPPGWGYSFGIFIVFNSLTCLLIAIGQWSIYREIRTSKKALGDRRSKSTTDARITRNLLLVVTTNFLCWLPVGLLGVLALADYAIPGDVYSWIAVFVLPINSAVNPILYTLSEKLQKKKRVPREADSKKMKLQLTAGTLQSGYSLSASADAEDVRPG